MSRMVIGALQLKLAIFDATSLKDKRRVIKSLKERVAHRFNVSIAEVGSLEHRQQAELGVAVVGNDGAFVQRSLDKIVEYVRRDPGAALVDWDIEVF